MAKSYKIGKANHIVFSFKGAIDYYKQALKLSYNNLSNSYCAMLSDIESSIMENFRIKPYELEKIEIEYIKTL